MMCAFYTINIISATKPYPDAKLGFSYKQVEDGGVIVTGIFHGGLISTTNLKVGQEITSVNGRSVRGLSMAEVDDVLKSIGKEIRLEVWTPLECARDRVPPLLFESARPPVPLAKWQTAYDAVTQEMAPALKQFHYYAKFHSKHMAKYVRNQALKGMVGGESGHERQTAESISRLAEASNTATLAATNALCVTNAMLYGHGVCAKLGFACKKNVMVTAPGGPAASSTPKTIAATPNGIGFMSVE